MAAYGYRVSSRAAVRVALEDPGVAPDVVVLLLTEGLWPRAVLYALAPGGERPSLAAYRHLAWALLAEVRAPGDWTERLAFDLHVFTTEVRDAPALDATVRGYSDLVMRELRAGGVRSFPLWDLITGELHPGEVPSPRAVAYAEVLRTGGVSLDSRFAVVERVHPTPDRMPGVVAQLLAWTETQGLPLLSLRSRRGAVELRVECTVREWLRMHDGDDERALGGLTEHLARHGMDDASVSAWILLVTMEYAAEKQRAGSEGPFTPRALGES